MSLLGFWSYVHADDDVHMGRVAQLGRDIVGNYEAQTAEEIQLFLDRDDLSWGDDWRDKIDDALSNVAFFIPIITPRYFTRVECRRELQFFLSRANALGISDLILPILYMKTPALIEEDPSDQLIALVQKFQWEDWTALAYEERSSGTYRAAVAKLAEQLVERVQSVERTDIVTAAAEVERAQSSDESDEGTLDRLSRLEEAMPRWTETLSAMQQEIEAIGELMSRGAEDITRGEQQGKGFAARLAVARRVADELGGPVDRIEALSQDFVADLNHIDVGIRTILSNAGQEVSDDPSSLPAICEYLDSVRGLAASSREGLGAVQGMIDATVDIEKISKDMRPPMRRLRTSLTAMLEAREITSAWASLVDELDIDCTDAIASEDRPAASEDTDRSVGERSEP